MFVPSAMAPSELLLAPGPPVGFAAVIKVPLVAMVPFVGQETITELPLPEVQMNFESAGA